MRAVEGVSPELVERARQVLAQLALVSEGNSMAWDPGHGQPGSRPPVQNLDRQAAPNRAPPKARSLYDHWAWQFLHATDAGKLRQYVLLAEEDLLTARKAPLPNAALREAEVMRLLKLKGLPPDEVAVRARVNVAAVRTERRRHGLDPENGHKLPEDRDELLAYARELAATPGISEREVARRTGLPRSTLQRHLQ